MISRQTLQYGQNIGCGTIVTLVPDSQEVSKPHHALSTEKFAEPVDSE
jgi:hypothetical protein